MKLRELLFEIGVEELPAGYVPPALEQLASGVRAGLEALRLRLGRPGRWVLALYGGGVLPVTAFGLPAGRSTFGHRFLHPGALDVREPAAYLDALRSAKVVADQNERRRLVVEQVAAAAGEHGGR